MVESSGLLNRRSALKRYRGFESLPLRQINLAFTSRTLLELPPKSTRPARNTAISGDKGKATQRPILIYRQSAPFRRPQSNARFTSKRTQTRQSPARSRRTSAGAKCGRCVWPQRCLTAAHDTGRRLSRRYQRDSKARQCVTVELTPRAMLSLCLTPAGP